MPAKLRLRDWDQLYQRAAAMEGAEARVRAALATYAPSIAARIWTEQSVMKYATTRMDRAALAGTSVRASARSTTFSGATRPSIPGLDPAAVEFGDGNQQPVTYRRRSRKGGTHQVTRNTQAQLPARNRRGRVIFRYGREAVRRQMSAYAQTIARTLHELLEGK
ncbi:hypothetical protein CBR64_00090 [Cellulosimicrobium cellulans]|uniref:HK97 gp10 family phage protein n=1 Tax=Cellulosimicrobium cellulans TaxID=1710 RepID=A0A1Y0HPX9_CELCE|nr:hypothetical protein [Cellulosimicrobium cellulans]ARU50151.1 hypothetical protein CBR64_00090 [Cellulosimicrobium cellulans]